MAAGVECMWIRVCATGFGVRAIINVCVCVCGAHKGVYSRLHTKVLRALVRNGNL